MHDNKHMCVTCVREGEGGGGGRGSGSVRLGSCRDVQCLYVIVHLCICMCRCRGVWERGGGE